jgi:hypothetical protein
MSGERIRVGARLSATVQSGPGAHPAFYAMGTGSLTGVERPGRGVDHPHPTSAEVIETVQLYLYSSSGPSWPVLGWYLVFLTFTFTTFCPVSCQSSNLAPKSHTTQFGRPQNHKMQWQSYRRHTTQFQFNLSSLSSAHFGLLQLCKFFRNNCSFLQLSVFVGRMLDVFRETLCTGQHKTKKANCIDV